MNYLPLETFKETDEESRRLARHAFRTEDSSTASLYSAAHNMEENDKWRKKTSEKGKKLIEENQKDQIKKYEEKQKTAEKLKSICKTIQDDINDAFEVEYEGNYSENEDFEIEEVIPQEKSNNQGVLSAGNVDNKSAVRFQVSAPLGGDSPAQFSKPEKKYFVKKTQNEEELEEESYEIETESSEYLTEMLSETVSNKLNDNEEAPDEDDEANDEDTPDTDDEELEDEYEKTMRGFLKSIKKNDISSAEGLNSIEKNLKCAVKLLVGGMAKRQLRMLIKPAKIQNLLTTFQNLRKTQWENRINYLPANLDAKQLESLRSIYKMEFLDAYEREARRFLSDYDYDFHKPGLIKRFGNRIKAKKDSVFEKFERKLDFKVKEKIDKKLARQVDQIEEISNEIDDVDEQEEIPSKKLTVFRNVLDLVAVTLRPGPKTEDGRNKKNTYRAHYNEYKKILEEYIEEDDNLDSISSSSAKMELKPKDSTSRKFLYTFYAILANYAGIQYTDADDVLHRETKSDKIFSTDIKFSDNNEHFKVSDDKQEFATLLSELQSKWKAIEKNGRTIRKEELQEFLKKFTTYEDPNSLRAMFDLLCSGNKININDENCKKYFNRLENLKEK